MPSIPRVVVWRSDADIQHVKALFYPDQPDKSVLAAAVNQVLAFQTRGPLPHSVETTALLTSAVLQDNAENTTYSIRLSYSMSLIRFVNGLLDPFQRSQYAIPMHLLAKQLQLPSYFVELRHSATHEGLPSLELLRDMASRALQWLWQHYWSANVFDPEGNSGPSYSEDDKTSVKELCREWRRLRREDPLREVKTGDQSPEGIQFWNLVKQFEKKIEQNEHLVMDVLLLMNVLIPKGSNADSAKNVKTASKLWTPLLQALNEDDFVTRLVCYGIDMMSIHSLEDNFKIGINESDSDTNLPSNFSAAWSQWVQYFLRYKPKKHEKLFISNPMDIVNICIDYPHRYTYEIVECYADITGDQVSPRILQLLNDMKTQLVSGSASPGSKSPSSKRKVSEIVDEVDYFKKRLNTLTDSPALSRSTSVEVPTEVQTTNSVWKLAENWTPRPLGVL